MTRWHEDEGALDALFRGAVFQKRSFIEACSRNLDAPKPQAVSLALTPTLGWLDL